LKTEEEKARRRQIELAGRTKKDDDTTLVPTGVPIDIVMTKAILYSNLSNCINLTIFDSKVSIGLMDFCYVPIRSELYMNDPL